MSEFFELAPLDEVLSALEWVRPVGQEQIPLMEAADRVLAADLHAGSDLPHFTRAVMDGYAVRAADTFGCSEAQPAYLDLHGTVATGDEATDPLPPGKADAISTGGMVPPGADAVVMWEYTRAREDLVEIFRPVAPGENIARAGEDCRRGEKVLENGRRLRPADIGLLSGLGITLVPSRKPPRVAIISTGDELVEPAVDPRPGQVRNVNQFSLAAWVRRFGGLPLLMGLVPDDLEQIVQTAEKGLQEADVVLISGGSSAGTKDLTRQVVSRLGPPGVLFHGLSVRPGKPTVIGARGTRPVIGLPGHPVSAMVIFLILVRPLINRLLGRGNEDGILRLPARLSDNLPSRAGRVDYYQVQLRSAGQTLEAVPVFRKSGLVTAMVKGEGMVRVASECEGLEAGAPVTVEVYG